MSAERGDYCPWCGTAPCRHPHPEVTLGLVFREGKDGSYWPFVRDLVGLVFLVAMGFVAIVLLAVFW